VDHGQVTHYSQEVQTDDFLAVSSALRILQLMLMTHLTGWNHSDYSIHERKETVFKI